MRPEVLHRIRVRDIAVALDSMDEVELVQHDVSRLEIRRYVALSAEQWWQLVSFVREREHANQVR